MDKVKNIMSLSLIAVLVGMLGLYLDPRVNQFAGFIIVMDAIYTIFIICYILGTILFWLFSLEGNKRDTESHLEGLESKVESLEAKLEEIKEDNKSEEWRILENMDNKKRCFTVETNWGILYVYTKYKNSDIVHSKIERFLDNSYTGYTAVYYEKPSIAYKVTDYVSRDGILSMLDYISRMEDTTVTLGLDPDRDII